MQHQDFGPSDNAPRFHPFQQQEIKVTKYEKTTDEEEQKLRKLGITPYQILATSTTPLQAPIFRHRPYRFCNRQYFIIEYETDPELLRKLIPYPLEPVSNVVKFDWIDMGDNPFGHYFESGIVTSVKYQGKQYKYPIQMFLNSKTPVHSGREYFGFAKHFGLDPEMYSKDDTLVGLLGGGRVIATMPYKYEKVSHLLAKKGLESPQICLKIINGPDFKPEIFKFCTFHGTQVDVKEAWQGPCTLEFKDKKDPLNILPIKKVLGAIHYIVDIQLQRDEVIYNHLQQDKEIFDKIDFSQKLDEPNTDSDFSRPEILFKSPCSFLQKPPYPRGPYKILNTYFRVIEYYTYRENLYSIIPEPLLLLANDAAKFKVYLAFSLGKFQDMRLGSFNQLQVFVNVDLNEKHYLYNVMSFTDNDILISMGREIYGIPYKPIDEIKIYQSTEGEKIEVTHSKICVLRAFLKKMKFNEAPNSKNIKDFITTPQLNLKLNPAAEEKDKADIAKLCEINYQTNVEEGITTFSATQVELSFINHFNIPLKKLPIDDSKEIVCNTGQVNTLTLGKGEYKYNYL